MKSKYIIIQHEGIEIPIVFHALLLHAEVAGTKKVKSAGYCELDLAGKWKTFGQSTSTERNTRPQDAEILNYLIKG